MKQTKLSYEPLYRQIYTILYERITSSAYKIGDEIPSEKLLAREFDVSISTIRQAVGLLVEQGLVSRKQGRGTSVTKNPITVRFFGWVGEMEKGERTVRKLIDSFEEKNPNLRVEYINSRYEDIKRDYIEMVQNGSAPDIVQLDNNWTSSLASMGLLEPLERLLPSENINSRYPEIDLRGGTYKGRLFSVAWGLGPSALIYNRKLAAKFELELAGEISLDRFFQICRQISGHPANSGEGAFGIAENIDIIYNIYPFLLAFGGNLVEEDGEIVMDCQEMALAFAWLRRLMEENKIKFGCDLRELREFLVDDKMVFLQDGPWIGGILKEESGYEDVNEHFGVLVNPKNPESPYSSFTRNHSLAISSVSEKKDVAAKFIDFLTDDPDSCRLYVDNLGLLSPNRKLASLCSAKNDQFLATFGQQLDGVHLLNAGNPLFEKALKFAADAAHNILFKGADIQRELREKAYYLEMLYND